MKALQCTLAQLTSLCGGHHNRSGIFLNVVMKAAYLKSIPFVYFCRVWRNKRRAKTKETPRFCHRNPQCGGMIILRGSGGGITIRREMTQTIYDFINYANQPRITNKMVHFCGSMTVNHPTKILIRCGLEPANWWCTMTSQCWREQNSVVIVGL